RHYYREHDTAMEAVAAILWQRYGRRKLIDNAADTAQAPVPIGSKEPSNRQALLRAETAHFHDVGQIRRLDEVLNGVVELAQEMARAKAIRLLVDVPHDAAA